MAKRRRTGDAQAGPTPKELVRRRRAREQNRTLFIGLGVVGLVIVGLLVAALVQEFAVQPASPVAVVNGSKIRTDVFQERVRFQYDNLQGQLYQWLQLEAQYGSDETTGGLFQQQISQIQSQLQNPDLLSQEILDRMIDEELVRQEAERLGLEASEAEIEQELEQQFGFVRNPTPTPIVTPQVITTTEVITGSEGMTSTQVISATATPRPTARLMTEDEYQENYSTTVQRLESDLGFTEADFRALIVTTLLEQKLQERLGEQVSTTEEQVRARHILIQPDAEAEDQDAAEEEAAREAQDAYAALQEGADFAELAIELSDDTGSAEDGGDLGWFGRGMMQPEFEEKAFSLALEEISEPFTTTFGYHILQVLEKDPARPVDEYTLGQRRSQAYDDWLQETRASASVERFWTQEKVPPLPTTPAVPTS